MKNQNILIIVAHPDDETIGMGGTIAMHSGNGDSVFCVSLTDGLGSRKFASPKQITLRKKAAESAAKILGFRWVEHHNFPDNAMDSVPLLSIVKIIENIKKKTKPDVIYTHSCSDLNIDHQIVCKATMTAFRPQTNETFCEIRTIEIPSSTDFGHAKVTGTFSPNLFISIDKFWKQKLEALQCYDIEIKEFPHSRSYFGIENLANLRGNQVGLKKAESFQILRKIQR